MQVVMEVVVVLVIAALALRGISNPFVALLALLVVYIVQPGELYPHLGVLHLERMLAIFTLLSFFLHGERLNFPPVTKWFLAFYGAMIASIPLAFWRVNSVGFCIFFLEVVFFHLLIVALLTSEERVKQFLITTVALTGWLAGTSLFMYETGPRVVHMGIERAEGLTSAGGDPNTLGLTLICTLPLDLLLLAKDNSKWVRLLGLGVCVVSIVTVIVTGSRTSFFGLLFMMLLLFIADWKRKLKFLPILLVVLPVLWLAVPQQYKARYETVDNLQADDSYQNRILSWEGGFHMFLHNPITGVGPDNYTVANGNKYWPGTGQKHWLNAHSLYFKLLGELGLIGVITYFGYLYQLFRENHRLTSLLKDQGVSRMLQKYPLHCQMCLCLLLFAGYSQHNTYRSQWFIFGAISAAVGRLQTEKTSSTVLAPARAKKGRPVGAWVPGAEAATVDALSIQRL